MFYYAVPSFSRPPDTDLAWLAGFVDGEGSIHAWIEKDRPRIKKGLDMGNTVERNVSKARSLIFALTGRDNRPMIKNVKLGYRPCYTLHIRRAEDIDIILRAILPWLVGKREHAEIMLRLLAIAPRSAVAGRAHERQRTPDNGRWRSCYTPEDVKLVGRLIDLNRRYAPGEWLARTGSTLDVPSRVALLQRRVDGNERPIAGAAHSKGVD